METQISDLLAGRLLIDAEEYSALIGVSRRTLFRWMAAGLIPTPVRVGRALRWRTRDVLEHVERLKHVPRP